MIGTEEVGQNFERQLYDLGVLDLLRTGELMVALPDRREQEISPAGFDHEQWATPRVLIDILEMIDQ